MKFRHFAALVGTIAAVLATALPANAAQTPRSDVAAYPPQGTTTPHSGTTTATIGDDVGIQSCYGSQKYYSSDTYGMWPHYPSPTYATTTTACADINIKPTFGTSVTVCFEAWGGACNGYKWAPGSQWTVIASNVRDGSRFWIFFETGESTGYIAY